MASLQQLLAEEGFERGKYPKIQKTVKPRERVAPEESIALPIYICHDRRSFESSKRSLGKAFSRGGPSVFSSKRQSSGSERSTSKSYMTAEGTRTDGPAIDEVAIRAVVSILSGYVGRYISDETFRENLREKCNSCLERKKKVSDNGVLANMELGIESIEKFLENKNTRKELRMKSLRNSIRLLNIVASLNSKNAKNNSTCGIPNSHLSACAQLYLSIIYKLEKNDRISARHLLQVFCDSPFMARTHLLPDLWEHFFLPHLLHLKIWYSEELEFLSNKEFDEKERRIKALSKVYNDQMDKGTTQFSVYYKEWLKVGAEAPSMPSVPLPSKPSYGRARRASSDSFTSQTSISKSLYHAVFGPVLERESTELGDRNGAFISSRSLKEEGKVCSDEDYNNGCSYVHNGMTPHSGLSSQNYMNPNTEIWHEKQRSQYFQLFTCRSEPAPQCLVPGNHTGKKNQIKREEKSHGFLNDLSTAINTICSSDILSDSELAIHVVARAWLSSHGDLTIETSLSKAPVIEGMLEVLYASNDDEILELVISILAEVVARNDVNRKMILNADPQLEIFLKLLRTGIFLKAAVLLYLLKPKAKQMISVEWIPLVLRVLEFGDQLQTLFTVRCFPQVAAYYFLDQLVAGFDEDRNLENARQVVSLGGLSLLVRRIEKGDTQEKSNAALIISSCIRADGSCRHYLANNLSKGSILELLVLRRQGNSSACAFAILTELLCLNRRTQIIKFLYELKNGGDGLNTMHILFVYLQRAPPEERPLAAAILLQLDLLGDPLKPSMYREEAVEAIIASLDHQVCNERVQEQSAKALLMLGGCFSYTGEMLTEKWLLQLAGFDEGSEDSFSGKDIITHEFVESNEEEEATDKWQRKAAIALLKSGNKRFLTALSDSMANSGLCLARASLVTVSWMSSFLHSIEDGHLRSMACSILVPRLLGSLNYDRALDERVLASFSLLSLVKSSGCVSTFPVVVLDRDLGGLLRNLSLVTWTANELISIITNSSQEHELENLSS